MAVGDVQSKKPAFACGVAFSLVFFSLSLSLSFSLSLYFSLLHNSKKGLFHVSRL